MIKVLVAEDEFPLLRGICILIEKLDPDFCVVMKARTGKEALEYLQNHDVDIIFADINMPVVDGLQVLKYVKQVKPRVIRVIISGYQDFSYAQQAMRYEVKRYLIKPIDTGELYELLQELKEQIWYGEDVSKDTLLEQIVFARNNFFCNEKKIEVLRERVEFENLHFLYFIAKAYCTSEIEEDILPKYYWEEIKIKNFFKEEVRELKRIYMYSMKCSNEMLFILEGNNVVSIDSCIKKFLCRENLQFPLAVAISDESVDISVMNRTINSLRTLIRENWRYGISEVVYPNRSQKDFCISPTTEESLRYMIHERKFEGFKNILLGLQKQMKKEQISQYNLEITLKKILLLIQVYKVKYNNAELERTDDDINEMIMRSNSFEELFDEFIFLCYSIMFPKSEEKREFLVKRMDTYIKENYSSSINTKMLAQEFGLVPSYLSKLFRDYKGLSPNHYIQNLRIEKTKEILEEYPSIMIKDVASMVGYEDSSYFSKVFKKITGIYPSEYQEHKLVEKNNSKETIIK